MTIISGTEEVAVQVHVRACHRRFDIAFAVALLALLIISFKSAASRRELIFMVLCRLGNASLGQERD
jgi:hypothetical protein